MGLLLPTWTFCCFISFILLRNEINAQDDVDYRLPATFSPSKYTIDLKLDKGIFNGTVTSFDGEVTVLFTALEDTAELKIHGAVTVDSMTLTSENGTELSSSFTYNTITEILNISVSPQLTENTSYTLSIQYKGDLDLVNMRGFYRSEYYNENGEKVFLVTTQFEPTHARKAFPCFDEPRYKAKFNINITYPIGLMALGNTNRQITDSSVDYETAVFTETPVMPTYLIAFIVSDFNCTEGNVIDTDVPHYVCSTKESAAERQLAVEYGPIIMKSLENMTGLKYKDQGLGKMHQVALPDFSAGAMENWGIVTYRESALLWNTIASSSSNKERVLSIIAHEFAHMWFGNLVTCDWWDYTFLNEGFARYFQYFSLAKLQELEVDQVWEMAKQFVIEQQQVIFTTDSFKNAMSLTSAAASPSEVSNKFGSISYNKGASIIRMLEHVMGSDNFFTGLNSYLTANSYSTAVPNQLWNSLEPEIPAGALPEGVNLIGVMENWINASGFPVVTVTIRRRSVILSQERFLYNQLDTDDTQYYIPISYTTSNMSEPFVDVSPSEWLTPGSTISLDGVMEYNDWIILNNQQSAYYRVNYSYMLWQKIIEALQTDLSKIHVLNRAQIVDDAFNLARAGIIDYPQAFNILSYLKNETEYYPWYPAVNGFNFLLRLYGEDSDIGRKLMNFEVQLLEGALSSVSVTNLNESDHIYSLKLNMVLNRACKLWDKSCIAISTELFQAYKNGTSIDKNLRSAVYCNGLRFSVDITNDWEFLWNKFTTETLTSEKLTLMSALGCTLDRTFLQDFLNKTLDPESGIRQQDLSTAWNAVYNSNFQGIDAALDFFVYNHERIYDYYSSASSLLSNIAARITNWQQLQLLETLATTNVSTTLQNAIKSAISSAQANINWATGRKVEIESYFVDTTTEAPVTNPSTLCTTTTSDTTTRSPTTSAGETTTSSIPTPLTGETTPSSISTPLTGETTPSSMPTPPSGETTPSSIPTPPSGETTPWSTPTPPSTTTEKGSAEMTKSVTLLPVFLSVLISVMLFT